MYQSFAHSSIASPSKSSLFADNAEFYKVIAGAAVRAEANDKATEVQLVK